MGTINRSESVKCWNDCMWDGCPEHDVEIRIQTTSDVLTITLHNKREPQQLVVDPCQWETILGLLQEVDYSLFKPIHLPT